MPNIIHGGGGGSDMKLNVFAQPDLPTDKFDGVLLQTSAKETLKKVVFDTNVWAAGQWQNPSEYGPLPYPVNAQATYFNGEIYYIGQQSFKYNPKTGITTVLSPYPITITTGLSQIIINNKIYCFGGANQISESCTTTDTNIAYCYDIETDTYVQIANLPCTAMDISLAYSDGYIYMFNFRKSAYSSTYGFYYPTTQYCYKYNIALNSYSSIASTLNSNGYPDSSRATCVIGNKIYLFGGNWFHNNTTYGTSNNVDIYNIDTNSYTKMNNLPINVTLGGVAINGDKVLIAKNTDQYNYMIDSDTYSQEIIPYNVGYAVPIQIADIIFWLNSIYIHPYMLTAKQYPDSPSIIFYRLSKDFTHETSIVKGKLIDNLPTNFKDCMLFKDGEITFPALYIGDGTQWNLARAAQ